MDEPARDETPSPDPALPSFRVALACWAIAAGFGWFVTEAAHQLTFICSRVPDRGVLDYGAHLVATVASVVAPAHVATRCRDRVGRLLLGPLTLAGVGFACALLDPGAAPYLMARFYLGMYGAVALVVAGLVPAVLLEIVVALRRTP